MQEFDHNEQERCFSQSITELDYINKEIARLLVKKEELTNNIISSLEHDHEGQKTYEYDVWRIEVKTPYVYSLNKKLYEAQEMVLPSDFNPIKESLAYSIDKKMLAHCMTNAPSNVRDTLIELIDKKPGKASITIKERVA